MDLQQYNNKGMEINYVENENGKLFSFFRHDYKDNTDKNGDFIMIDGGFDYSRYSGKIKSGEIKDLMSSIREQFTWGKNYDENGNRLEKTEYKLLKDLTTTHISGILRYFTERLTVNTTLDRSWISIHLIFIYELENRLKNDR